MSESENKDLRRYRESARPFIVFPLNDSDEGWIKVAEELQIMINYLIDEKCERVVVRYIDRRSPDGSVEDPRDYGLAVEAFRTYLGGENIISHDDFLKAFNQRPLPDGDGN